MAKAELERVYNIPLRKSFIDTPKYKRAKKAVSAVKTFLKKHMKTEEVRLGQELNKKIWARGMKNPPHHVEVKVVREIIEEVPVAKAELVGFEYKEAVKAMKKEEPKSLKEKIAEKLEKPKKEDKDEARKEVKTEAGVKKEEKEIKEKKEEKSVAGKTAEKKETKKETGNE